MTMMEKSYADQILDGDVACNSCGYLSELKDDVEKGRLSVEEFRRMVNAAKMEALKGTV